MRRDRWSPIGLIALGFVTGMVALMVVCATRPDLLDLVAVPQSW